MKKKKVTLAKFSNERRQGAIRQSKKTRNKKKGKLTTKKIKENKRSIQWMLVG